MRRFTTILVAALAASLLLSAVVFAQETSAIDPGAGVETGVPGIAQDESPDTQPQPEASPGPEEFEPSQPSWTRIERAGDRFAISIPPGWAAVDLEDADLKGQFKKAFEAVSVSEDGFTMLAAFSGIYKLGGATLLAFPVDGAVLSAMFPVTMTVARAPLLPPGGTLDSAAATVLKKLDDSVSRGTASSLEHGRVSLPAGEAERISYVMAPSHLEEYVFVRDGEFLDLTFVCPISRLEEFGPLFEEMAGTFRLLEPEPQPSPADLPAGSGGAGETSWSLYDGAAGVRAYVPPGWVAVNLGAADLDAEYRRVVDANPSLASKAEGLKFTGRMNQMMGGLFMIFPVPEATGLDPMMISGSFTRSNIQEMRTQAEQLLSAPGPRQSGPDFSSLFEPLKDGKIVISGVEAEERIFAIKSPMSPLVTMSVSGHYSFERGGYLYLFSYSAPPELFEQVGPLFTRVVERLELVD